MAAAALIAVGLGRIQSNKTSNSTEQATIPNVPAAETTVAATNRERGQNPALRSAVAEAGEAVASLTSRTADQALDNTRLLMPVVSGPRFDDVELPGDATARPLREAGQNLSVALGPVAASARRAVDLFIRELPPVSTQERKGS
jgi:hypothetical protein